MEQSERDLLVRIDERTEQQAEKLKALDLKVDAVLACQDNARCAVHEQQLKGITWGLKAVSVAVLTLMARVIYDIWG